MFSARICCCPGFLLISASFSSPLFSSCLSPFLTRQSAMLSCVSWPVSSSYSPLSQLSSSHSQPWSSSGGEFQTTGAEWETAGCIVSYSGRRLLRSWSRRSWPDEENKLRTPSSLIRATNNSSTSTEPLTNGRGRWKWSGTKRKIFWPRETWRWMLDMV